MVQNENYYLPIAKADFQKVGGDFKSFVWLGLLKDYRRRFKRDRYGFTRVPSNVFLDEFGADRVKVWRYNKILEDKGLIKVDRKHRGGRTWIGYRII